MKAKICSLLLAVMWFGSPVQGETTVDPEKKEFVKIIEESYGISPDGEVKLSNKYGVVEIKTHNENRVNIKVELIASARSESAANSMFDKMHINLNSSNDQVSVYTEIENNCRNKTFLSWGYEDHNYQINYYIEMPASCKLSCSNKYGHVRLEDDMEAPTALIVKYGNIEAQDFEQDLSVDLKYGDGSVGSIDGMLNLNIAYSEGFEFVQASEIHMNAAYAKVSADNLGMLTLNSKYSKFDFEEVSEFENYSKFDHFDIGTLTSAKLDAKYTEFDIDELRTELTVANSYGNVRIDEVSKEVQLLMLDVDYTGVDIDFDEDADYIIDFETSYTGVRVPISSFEVIRKEYEENKRDLVARKGSGRAEVKIRMKYGDLRIDQ